MKENDIDIERYLFGMPLLSFSGTRSARNRSRLPFSCARSSQNGRFTVTTIGKCSQLVHSVNHLFDRQEHAAIFAHESGQTG